MYYWGERFKQPSTLSILESLREVFLVKFYTQFIQLLDTPVSYHVSALTFLNDISQNAWENRISASRYLQNLYISLICTIKTVKAKSYDEKCFHVICVLWNKGCSSVCGWNIRAFIMFKLNDVNRCTANWTKTENS